MMKKYKSIFFLRVTISAVFFVAMLFVELPQVSARNLETNHNPVIQDFAPNSNSIPGDYFIHKATTSNSVDNYTLIDYPLLNNNPDAIMLVTQNQSPDAFGGSLNNHPLGVWYSSDYRKWAVFNEDVTPITDISAFNIMIPDSSTNAFVHTAETGNIVFNSTFIDNPHSNGNPNAIILVTQNWNPGGGPGVFNNHNIGVWYNTTNNKWAIFNEDTQLMPVGASFNVIIPISGSDAFVHTSTPANTSLLSTRIDNTLTNSNRYAILFATPNWNPGAGAGYYYNYPPSVMWSIVDDKWAISNQTVLEMPVGVSFNIIVKDNRIFLPFVIR